LNFWPQIERRFFQARRAGIFVDCDHKMNQAPSGATSSEYAAPTGLCSSPIGWERMPKAGEGFSFFGFGSTNMPRRRRSGRAGSPLPAERPNAKTGAVFSLGWTIGAIGG
jgi:hypothetical protein